MKFTGFYIPLFTWVVATGCESHHPKQVVSNTPAPTAPVYTPSYAPVVPSPPMLPPTSEPRVSAVPPDEAVNLPSEPPPGVSSQDVAIAESISKLLRNDAHMASISGNVQTTVDQGVVSLRGTVPSENAMDEIRLRIAKLAGVAHIHNHLSISNR